MILIGEKLNSSIKSSRALIESRDEQKIIELAKAQMDAGAQYIDINAGAFLEREGELLAFLAKQAATLGAPLSIDTPSAKAAEQALKAAGTRGNLLNSVTIEPERLNNMTSLAAEYGCSVIALCMGSEDTGDTADDRIRLADTLVSHLTKNGIRPENIFIDPTVLPIGADDKGGVCTLETIRRLRELFPECHISIGLSNISFGLPERRLINRAFAVAAMSAGLDSMIADPFDRELMGIIAAAEAVLGHDEYCLEYINRCREGMIG